LNHFVSLILSVDPFLINFKIKTLAKKGINCCVTIHIASNKKNSFNFDNTSQIMDKYLDTLFFLKINCI